MANLSLISYSELIVMLNKALNDGTLQITKDGLRGQTEIDLSEFYEVCHEKNIEPEEAMKRCVKMLWA